MFRFSDEKAVTEVLDANLSTGPGIYTYPNFSPEYKKEGETDEELKARHDAFMNGEYEGLFVFSSISRIDKNMNMYASMGYNYGVNFLASLLIVILLCWSGIKSFVSRVVFVEIVAVFTALAVIVPGWIWLHMPDRHILMGIVDLVVAWGLAGIVIALVLGGGQKATAGGGE